MTRLVWQSRGLPSLFIKITLKFLIPFEYCIDSNLTRFCATFLLFYNFSIFFSFFSFSLFFNVWCELWAVGVSGHNWGWARVSPVFTARSRCGLGSGERGTIWPVVSSLVWPWSWQSLSSHITHTQSYLRPPAHISPTSSTQFILTAGWHNSYYIIHNTT